MTSYDKWKTTPPDYWDIEPECPECGARMEVDSSEMWRCDGCETLWSDEDIQERKGDA